jgi:DeoR family transcriptional regulator, aga operon transcriptional repressor
MSLKTDDRANQILRVLLRHGRASMEDLMQELETSAPNIRRDLAKLERRGLVCRTHGDAEFQTREERFVKEKRRIALAAADLIQEHETIAFTAGTTTTQIARSIRHRSNLRIVTNAVNIGMELCNQPGLKTSLTGGVVQWAGSFSLIGPAAIQSLGEINVDRAFIGVCGMNAKRGASTIEMDEAVVFRAMARQARQVVVVADSSKMGMVSPGLICPAAEVHMVITDVGVSPDVVAELQAKGVEVIAV